MDHEDDFFLLPYADPLIDFSTMTPAEINEYVMTHDMSTYMDAHPDRTRFVQRWIEEAE